MSQCFAGEICNYSDMCDSGMVLKYKFTKVTNVICSLKYIGHRSNCMINNGPLFLCGSLLFKLSIEFLCYTGLQDLGCTVKIRN